MVSRLRSLLYPPGTSSRSVEANINPNEILQAVTPLLARSLRHHLDPMASDISEVIFRHFVRRQPGEIILPATQKTVGEVLSVCHTQTARQQFASKGSVIDESKIARTDRVAEEYALYLLHQAVNSAADRGRLSALLSDLEESFNSYKWQGSGYRISAPLTAAFVVLRTKLGIANPSSPQFIWPKDTLVLSYIDKYMTDRGLSSKEFAQPLSDIYASNPMPQLPLNLNELKSKVTGMVRRGQEDALLDLWRQLRDYLSTKAPQTPASGSLLDPSIRHDVLLTMLEALKSPQFGQNPPIRTDLLDAASDELISILPRPYSRSIVHALLANRAKVITNAPEVESGSAVYALDRSEQSKALPMSRKEIALKNLHDIWLLANEKGAERDVKTYMLYMEGLGRLGDLHSLKQTWEALVKDPVCRDIEKRENRESRDR